MSSLTHAEIVRNLMSDKAKVDVFSGKRGDFASWKAFFRIHARTYGYLDHLKSSAIPKFDIEIEDGNKAEVVKIVNQYKEIHNQALLNLIRALPTSFRNRITNLPKWSFADAMKKQDFKDDDDKMEKVREWLGVDEDGLLDSESSHIAQVFNMLSDKFKAKTHVEKQGLDEQLRSLEMKGDDFEGYMEKMDSLIAEMRDCDMNVDDDQIHGIVIKHMPQHARPLLTDLSIKDSSLEESREQLENYFRTYRALNSSSGKVADESNSGSQVLNFQYAGRGNHQAGYGGWRGRGGRGRGRGGRGGGYYHNGNRGESDSGVVQFNGTCNKCGQFGHKAINCEQNKTAPSAQVNVTSSQEICSYCGRRGHSVTMCKDKKRADDRKAKANRKQPVESKNLVIRKANLESNPDEHKAQLDSAADTHICGIPDLFVPGSLSDMEVPTKIVGISGSEHCLYAKKQGTIRLNIILNGRVVTQGIDDVLFVPEYLGVIIAQGILTGKGFDVRTKGCKHGKPGRTTILENGVIKLQGTQLPGSPRTYIDIATSYSSVAVAQGGASTCTSVVEDKVAVETAKSGSVVCPAQKSRLGTRNQQEEPNCCVPEVAEVCISQKPSFPLLDFERTGEKPAPEQKIVVQDNLPRAHHAKSSLERWHQRLHVGTDRLRRTLDKCGIHLSGVSNNDVSSECHDCLLGKSKHVGHPKSSSNLSTVPGEVWHVDVFGPTRTESLGGSRYSCVVGDEASMYAQVFFGARKNEFAEKVIRFLEFAQAQYGIKIKEVCTDNAPEFIPLWEWCEKNHIKVRKTVAGESAQNGLAERLIGELTESARTLIISCGASMGFWTEAFSHACYIHNNTAHARIDWKLPVEVLTGKPARINYLRVFGCAAYVHIEHANKLGAQATLGVYVGVDHEKKGWKIWFMEKHKVFTVWNVKFVEHRFPWKQMKSRELGNGGALEDESAKADDTSDEFLFPNSQLDNHVPVPHAPAPAIAMPALPQPAIIPRAAPPAPAAPAQAPAPAPAPVVIPPPALPIAQPVMPEPPLADNEQVQEIDAEHDAEPAIDQPVVDQPVAAPHPVPVQPVLARELRSNRGVPPKHYEPESGSWNRQVFVSKFDDVVV